MVPVAACHGASKTPTAFAGAKGFINRSGDAIMPPFTQSRDSTFPEPRFGERSGLAADERVVRSRIGDVRFLYSLVYHPERSLSFAIEPTAVYVSLPGTAPSGKSGDSGGSCAGGVAEFTTSSETPYGSTSRE